MIELPNRIFFEQVETLLAEEREVMIRMKGDSMRPLLRSERDRVVVAPCDDAARLRPGEVVLFRCGEAYVLHRIVGRRGDRLTLAGDGNCGLKERCVVHDVVGIATRVIRPSGRTVDFRSRSWRLRSRLWLALPPLLRRVLLRAFRAVEGR